MTQIWIDVTDSAGAKYGDGPITTAVNWTQRRVLDAAGSFSFEMPASDPRAALLANRRYAHCYSVIDDVVTEIGSGIIDRIEIDAGDPTMLRVSGPDLLAELGARIIPSLTVCEQELINLIYDDTAGYWRGSVRWLSDRYGVTFDVDLPEAHDGITDSGGETIRLWREATVYADWLYVGVDARFDYVAVTLSGEYLETNRAETTLIGQYFNGADWVDLPDMVDGTSGWVDLGGGHYATMNTSGNITWTRPSDWARVEPTAAAGSWFWVRFTVESGTVTDDFVLREVQAYADVPTTDGVNIIMAHAPNTWTTSGYDATAADKYLELTTESVLSALRALVEQGGQDESGDPIREHFTLGTTRILNWISAFTDSGVRAVQLIGGATPGEGTCLISSLRETADTSETVNRVYPVSNDGITLHPTTRVAPSGYTLSTTDGYLQHDAGVTALGQIDAAPRFTDIQSQQSDSWYEHPMLVANALYDRALEFLRTHGTIQHFYELEVVGAPTTLGPGQTIRVVYHEYVDAYHSVNIDAVLYIVGASTQVDVDGLRTVTLDVATVDRDAASDVGVVVETIEDVRRLGASGASLWQMAAGSTGAGLQVFEGPDIGITGDGLERTIGRAGDHVLLFDSGGATLGEYDTITLALAAATSGDCVQPQAKTYTESFTIPAGVTVRGRGPSTVIVGTVTLGDGAALVACQVLLDVDQAGDAICVVPPSGDGEMAFVYGCTVSANNATGNGYAVCGVCAHLTLRYCYVSAQSAGVDSNPFATGQYLRGTQIESWQIDSEIDALQYSSSVLDDGVVYWLVISGTFNWKNAGDEADALYTTENSWVGYTGPSPWLDTEQSKVPLSGWLDTAYNPDHIYDCLVTGDGSTLGLRINDSLFTDNEGSLTVTMYSTTREGGTPYAHCSVIPNADGRALALPEYSDRASWRTDYESGATHADDWESGDSHHAAMTLSDAADTVLALTGQALDLDAQAANAVFAGPVSGTAATPTFRALDADDLPAHASTHENGGADEISVAGLSGQLADGQTPVNHDHSGDAGDGGTFDAANLTSGAATDGQVLTADGSGGAAWEDAPGSPLTVEEQDGTPSVASVEKIRVTNGTLTDEGSGIVKLDFGSAATDGSAIHDNVAEEIHAVTEKQTPADNDELLIEDSADSWAKKRVKKSNLGSGDVTWAIIQASQLTNEFKGFPSMVGIDIDLDAANQWWDKEGTPTTAVTMVDVAGEAGLTETYEYALKTVTDAASEGLSQTWTYADEPRVKSGRKLSAMCAIWSVSNLSVTAKLVNSDASETAASAVTAAAWTIVKIENHTLAGSSCKFQVTAAGAGTFYVVPLGACIGQKAVPLGPRSERFVMLGDVNIVNNTDPNASWVSVDITAVSSALAFRALLVCGYYNQSAAGEDLHIRVKGSTATGIPTAVVRALVTSQIHLVQGQTLLDNDQIFEYVGSSVSANTEHCYFWLRAYWEWG